MNGTSKGVPARFGPPLSDANGKSPRAASQGPLTLTPMEDRLRGWLAHSRRTEAHLFSEYWDTVGSIGAWAQRREIFERLTNEDKWKAWQATK